MSLVAELQRRNVFRVLVGYLAGAWLVFQVVETVFPILGIGDNVLRGVLVILAIGLIPTAVAAWVFEITPDGIRLDSGATVDAPVSAKALKALDRGVLIVLAIAVGFFAFDKFVLDPARDAASERRIAQEVRSDITKSFYGDRSIAVLPFRNLSSDTEQQYFADGVAEEILNTLGSIRELRVISRSSAFRFRGDDVDVAEIREILDVGHLLEGSIRRSGERVRVSARLVETATDTQIWSATYDREIGDIFAMQDEIAARVAVEMEMQLLTPLPKSQVTDPDVVALTAQAKQLAETRSEGFAADMHRLLTEALAIDPDYLPALEWMISANFFRQVEGGITTAENEALRQQVSARILEIDPENASVISTQAWEAAYRDGDFERAGVLFERAVRSGATDSNVLRIAGVFAGFIGHFDVSEKLLRHAIAIDPFCFQCLYHLSRIYLHSGKYSDAYAIRERYLAIGSGGYYHRAIALLLQDEPETALGESAEIDGYLDTGQGLAIRAMVNFEMGNHAEAEALVDELVEREELMTDPLPAIDAAAWTGKNDLAFTLLVAAYGEPTGSGPAPVFSPTLENLHADPRWSEWREAIGMSSRRLDAIEFDPKLPGDPE